MLEGRSVFYLATTILLLYCCGNLWYSQQLAPHFSASGNINNESLHKNLSDDEIFNSEMGHSRGVHNNDVNITTIQIGGDVKVDQKCREYSAETLRAHGVHWKVDAINASVTMFPLSRTDEKRGKGTLGVHIVIGRETNNLSSSFNSSQQQYTHMVGREALRHEQSTLLSNKNSKFIPNILARADDAKGPNYDQFLGCPDNKQPNGTAIVVVQNFYCANIWHALANLHGIWLLMEIAGVEPSHVTAILPSKYGSTFKSPPIYIADVLWPLFVSDNNHSHNKGGTVDTVQVQTNCFEQILFMETQEYRPGPYWEYTRLLREGVICSKDSPYMKMQSRFRLNVRQTALKYLGIDTGTALSSNDTKPIICYMSRRRREVRVRYFSKELAPSVEEAIDAWSMKNKHEISFQNLEFDESVLMADQIEKVCKCKILFGPHGAGLAHQVFMPRGGHIIEIGTPDDAHKLEPCSGGYFGSMAHWYGHSYTCFTELEGHGVVVDKKGVFNSINVTLLLNVLDDTVESATKSK